MDTTCIFCKIVKGEVPGKKVAETDNFIVIKDAYPETEGHSLVIPKEHYETFNELPENLYSEFMQATKKGIDALVREYSMKGYNFVMNNKKIAGQLVPHMHLHIIPRREGDGIKVLG